jgi:gas vesicle protein
VQEATVSGGEVLVLLEERLTGGEAIFAADPLFDEGLLVDVLVNVSHGALGKSGGDAALAEIAEHAIAAEALVGETRGGKAFGEAAVVKVTVILEAGEHVVDIGGALRAAAEFLAKLARGMGAAGQRLQCVGPQCIGVDPANSGLVHECLIYWGVYWKWLIITAFGSMREPIVRRIKMDKSGLSSFLLGLGVGVGIGMLFAPKSGEETRNLIKNKAGEGSEFIKNKAGEGTEYVKQRSSEIKQNASEWVDRGKDAISRQRDSLSEAMEAGRQAYRDTVGRETPPPAEGPAHS